MKIFKEEQRFTQTWLIALIVISTIVPTVIIINEYKKGQISLNGLLSTIGIMFFFSGLIFFFKLTTRVDEHGIHYQFFPFHFSMKKIGWNEIEKPT